MTIQDRLKALVAKMEVLMNAEIPNTPRITGRGIGGRVMYVPLPGQKRIRATLSARAAQVLDAIERQNANTSAQIQATLKVNRNVVAGAIHELKQFKLVRPKRIDMDQMIPVGTSGATFGRRATDADGAPPPARRATDRPEGPQAVGTVGRRRTARTAPRRRRPGR